MPEPHRVLICDDSLGFPTLVETWLHEDGRFAVVGRATHGAEALRLVDELHPDVLVLDLVLPDVTDSPALVRDLRELHPPLRIMLVSSLHTAALERAAAASGVHGFCNKAATAEELAERLYGVASGG